MGFYLQLLSDILQTLQNKAIRAIAKLKSKDRVIPIYKQYNLLKTNDIYRLEIAKFKYHFHTKPFPFIFTDYFMYLKDCHHKTRIYYKKMSIGNHS